MITFKRATTTQEFEIGKSLFQAYAQAIGIDLSFQNFTDELENINEQYGGREGALLIAYSKEDEPVGCCGIRKIDEGICELKRMYIIPRFQGYGIGRQMMEQSISIGKELGYEKMRLDTLPTMQSAVGLYKKYGFYEIEPYRYNPIKEALFFEKNLSN